MTTEKVKTVEENPVDKKSSFDKIILPPLPSTPAQVEENILPPIEAEVPVKNFVRAKYFFNGKQINDWQDNLVEDAAIWREFYIPGEFWENTLNPINFPLEIRIENFSAESFTPQLEITFEYEGKVQTQNLIGQILNFGQTQAFNIPLNQFRAKGKFMSSAKLNVKILGAAQIIGSTATIDFIFAMKGFPLINN